MEHNCYTHPIIRMLHTQRLFLLLCSRQRTYRHLLYLSRHHVYIIVVS